MRQVFSSPRIENVERVAQLLRDHGIEVRVTNGRSYKGGHRMAFSYRDDTREDPNPAVWVVQSDDQPKAREVLREVGLLDSGRSPTSYLPTSMIGRDREDSAADRAKRRAFRIKAGLLLGIGFAMALGLLAYFRPGGSPAAPALPAAPQIAEGERWQVATPHALAAMLLDNEIRAHAGRIVCASVDDGAPSREVLTQMKQAKEAAFRARAGCPSGADTASTAGVDIFGYMTDGSGVGQIRMDVTEFDADGKPQIQKRLLDVERDGDRWRIAGIELL